jgi:transcriptional regulator with XRE-family HTH domain
MEVFCQNVRFLLWRANVRREAWIDELARWAGCDPRRACELLRSGKPSPAELETIARRTGVSEEDLVFAPLLQAAKTDILKENLRVLTDQLRRGEKGALAGRLQVHASTLSKWRSGGQRPERATVQKLAQFCGLPRGVDLESEPLFLSLQPVNDPERRSWLHTQIDRLDTGTLTLLFPALERLLEER